MDTLKRREEQAGGSTNVQPIQSLVHSMDLWIHQGSSSRVWGTDHVPCSGRSTPCQVARETADAL